MSQQIKLVNLGRITTFLKNDGIPNLLLCNLSKEYLDTNIKLRLFPLSLPILPALSGQLQYLTCLNTLRVLCNRFLLDHGKDHLPHKLNIISINQIKSSQLSQNKLFITKNDKLLIKWKTSPNQLNKNNNIRNNGDGSGSNYNLPLTMPQYVRVEDGNFTEIKNDRMVKGTFIFEFNSDNSKILIHTIENIEFYHLKSDNENTTNVSIC
ncbi:Mco32p PWA37_004067 [Arxiozyma heterogenica]|uniref:Uncharacterized protein n=1 Tax=Arxiozyma heterogenica TaxID=278026 RepID=A0AAN7WLZ3_9SACH|nr:hypothetical protein RI543_003096 [Kazachstania heterogenica]